jgi:3-oxoacyl-[acyl-carrier-protein] synthase-3
VLFGDGCAAVVLQATDADEGLLAERLGCYGESREILRVHGMGAAYAHQDRVIGKTEWQFEGQEIFKKAVHGMTLACREALAKVGLGADDVDLVIPHQANMRIIESVAKHAGVPMDRVFTNVHRYGNMSAATVPVALCEALEEGRVRPGALLLMPSFGGGLTFTGHVVRWGSRVTPLGESEVELPPNNQTALQLVQGYRGIAQRRVVPG